ncbi:MAG TPA: hypothetical protein VN820_01625 [Acidimicrobiales bacterium]|nr:hypothetical protein [Acidimicrobiales bacterium]
MRVKAQSALRSPHLGAAGIIVVIALAWFFPLFTGNSFSAVPGYEDAVYPWAAHNNGQAFYPQSDQAALNYPWQSELTLALRTGTIPWWNPDSFGGQPLYANGSSALLYPPRLALAELVSPRTAHNALSVFHVTLAGLFFYWLLVDLELTPLAALFGAIAWMFGSFTLAWLQLEVVAPVFAWLPAGLVLMRRSILSSWRWTVGAAAAIAMLFASTHLLFADISFVTICLYGGCLSIGVLVARREVRGWRILAPPARALTSAALGVGLGALVLIPTASSLSGISRQALSFTELSKGMLLSFSDLRYALWPPPLPITANELNFNVAFAGTLTAVCAVVGLVLRRKGSGLGRGLVLGSVLVAVGGPVSWLAFTVIPGMNIFRPYARLLFLFDLGLAVLGAVGLDAIMRRIAGSGPISAPPGSGRRGGRSARSRRWWVSRGVAVAVVATTAVQLGHYGREINPPFLPSRPSLSFPATALIRALQSGSGGVAGWPSRILPANDTTSAWQPPMLDSNDPLIFGIASANGYDSSVPTRTVDIWRVVAGEMPGEVIATKLSNAFQPTFDAPDVRFDLLPRLGVNQIAVTPPVAATPSLVSKIEVLGWRETYSADDGAVFTWMGPPTGPVVVFDAEHVADDATSLARFTSPAFDYRREVILDSPGRASVTGSGQARILAARQGYNTAEVSLTSSRPGYLVVPAMWDPGWSATVNGVGVRVERGNFNEQVVPVPAGRSVVELHYRPVGLVEGAVVSVAALVACGALLFWPLRRKLRRQRSRRAGTPTGEAADGPLARVESGRREGVTIAEASHGPG